MENFSEEEYCAIAKNIELVDNINKLNVLNTKLGQV